MTTDTSHFKTLLEDEKKRIEGELAGTTTAAGGNGKGLEATQPETGEDTADREDVAEAIESYENNDSAVVALRTQLNEVDRALGKIADGSFGTCEVCSEPIEEERLEANPSSRTCKEHAGEL